MTIEQRKLALITWITSIQSEELINHIEEFRDNQKAAIPNSILELLHQSSSAKPEDCIEHTSARELLGRK